MLIVDQMTIEAMRGRRRSRPTQPPRSRYVSLPPSMAAAIAAAAVADGCVTRRGRPKVASWIRAVALAAAADRLRLVRR